MIQPDPQTSSLVVMADKETLEKMAQVIKGLDKAVPQVLVKVLFLEVTHTNDLDIGVETNVTHKSDNGNTSQIGASGFGLGLADSLAKSAAPLLGTPNATTGLAAINAAHQALSGGGYYQFSNDDLQITLRALANATKLDVLSRPSVLVRNNQTANVTVGQQIPMITNSRVDTAGNTINTIQYTNVGIILDVTPRITTGKMVEMNVAPQISALTAQTVPVSAGTNTVSAPVIAMRSATTTVIAQSGKTIVIGGMMQDNNTSSVDKIPILGDIPLLGHLFRHTVMTKAKTELLIFLTPFIVESPEELQDVSMSENAQAQMSKSAFTPDEIDKYVDNLKNWPEKPLTDRPVPEKQPKASNDAPVNDRMGPAQPQDEQPSEE
jgi:general secretion pathway protein D